MVLDWNPEPILTSKVLFHWVIWSSLCCLFAHLFEQPVLLTSEISLLVFLFISEILSYYMGQVYFYLLCMEFRPWTSCLKHLNNQVSCICVALAVLELALYIRLALSPQKSACLRQPSALHRSLYIWGCVYMETNLTQILCKLLTAEYLWLQIFFETQSSSCFNFPNAGLDYRLTH